MNLFALNIMAADISRVAECSQFVRGRSKLFIHSDSHNLPKCPINRWCHFTGEETCQGLWACEGKAPIQTRQMD